MQQAAAACHDHETAGELVSGDVRAMKQLVMQNLCCAADNIKMMKA
jgi:hypothetical protein